MELNRRFGVEIECYTDFRDSEVWINGKGWECKYDGSLDGYEEGYYGREFTSPPLTNTDDVLGMYAWLHRHDLVVQSDCGLHIHVDAGDFRNSRDFHKVLVMMVAVEPIIYTITGRQRLNNSYCRPLAYNRTEVLSALACGDYDFSDDSRYYGLNFKSHEDHGTIEFRYFAPQESGNKVTNYIELVTKLVDFCKHATLEQVKVIASQIYYANFDDAVNMLVDVLELSFVPKRENDSFEDGYDRIKWSGLSKPVAEEAEAV